MKQQTSPCEPANKICCNKINSRCHGLLTAMASTIFISSCQLQPLYHSSFLHRISFLKTPTFSSPRNFLHIQSQKKSENFSSGKNSEQKQNSPLQNASPRFSELKALKFRQSHKNPTPKTPPNHRQTAHKNEGKRQARASNPKNSSPESEEDSKLNNRASSEPSLRGEDIILALQRVSLEKAKERSRKSKQKAASTAKGGKGFQEMTREKWRVIAEVRPIDVKPQWAAKIESLEKRLKELKEIADIT